MSTGNSLDFTKEDMDAMQRHGVAVKEMEAAAIAWAAHLFGTPMFALKAITDIVDGERGCLSENYTSKNYRSFLRHAHVGALGHH